MRKRQIHLVICLLAVVAYGMNLTAVAGNAVLCDGPGAGASIEFVCDHGHCSTTGEVGTHESEHGPCDSGCECLSCPCEDSPVGTVLETVLRDDCHGVSVASCVAFRFAARVEVDGWDWVEVGRVGCAQRDVDDWVGRVRTVRRII